MSGTKDQLILQGQSVLVDQDIKAKFQQAKNTKSSIEDFIHNFLMQFISPETQRSYMTDLRLFFEFVGSGGDQLKHPQDIKSYHFQVYRDHLRQKKYSSATINRRLVAIRSFMKWAVALKMIDHNPLDVVKLPRVQTESPTEAFDDHEVVKMIETPKLNEKRGNVQRLSMVLLFYLGLRRSELTQIKLQDIIQDRKHLILKIRGKGDKIRLLPLNDVLKAEIQNYLERMKNFDVNLEKDHYLLNLNSKNPARPVDGSTIYRMITNIAKLNGINKKVSPHSCRATVISHLLDTQQTPIRDVATFAGHSQITTTERYDKRRKNLDKNAAYQVDFKKTA